MKTFILGIGAQRCGTTWFYEYLSQYENFNGGFAKEYHIWDALDIQVLSTNRVGKPNQLLKLLQITKNAKRYKMQTFFRLR